MLKTNKRSFFSFFFFGRRKRFFFIKFYCYWTNEEREEGGKKEIDSKIDHNSFFSISSSSSYALFTLFIARNHSHILNPFYTVFLENKNLLTKIGAKIYLIPHFQDNWSFYNHFTPTHTNTQTHSQSKQKYT